MSKYLPTAAPEACGVSSESIIRFVQALCRSKENQETHGFLLIRHGKLIAEGYFAPYHKEVEHSLFSVSKSFTSIAIGFLVDAGKITVEDTIAQYFPELLADDINPENKTIKIKDLLSMSFGQHGGAVHEKQTAAQSSDVMLYDFFYREKDIPCGQEFRYDSFGTYMLSALVSKLTGKSVVDFLQDKLFEPLDIPTPYYIKDRLGISIGYTGMRLKLRDLAKVGLTFLNDGKWEGKQIVPADWVHEAMQKHIPTTGCSTGADWQEGYCYQFWKGRHNTTRLCGAFGQMCVIMPDYDAVFAIQSGFDNDYLSYILDNFYESVMFNMKEEALPENPQGVEELQKTLEKLSLVFETSSVAPVAQFVNGKKFPLQCKRELYDGVSFDFGEDDDVTVSLWKGSEVKYQLSAGFKEPKSTVAEGTNFAALERNDHAEFLSTAYWTDKTKLTVKARMFGTPTLLYIQADFSSETPSVQLYTVRGNFAK